MCSQTASDWSDALNNTPLIGRLFPCGFFPCEKAFREWPLVRRIWLGEHVGASHSDWWTLDARCPGKMASEEQCSAPPRWRSISLTHVEYPAGKGIFSSLFTPRSRSRRCASRTSRRGLRGRSRNWMASARAGLPDNALQLRSAQETERHPAK